MRSEAKNSLESRMLGNLHVRFGVGVGLQTPGLHHFKQWRSYVRSANKNAAWGPLLPSEKATSQPAQ